MSGKADYRKLNDGTCASSTYHKKDGTEVRAILKEETKKMVKFELSRDLWNELPFYLQNMTRLDTIFNWIKGYLPSGIADWSDGAWMAAHEEATDAACEWYLANHDNPVQLFDWYDIMAAYLEWSNNQ